MLGAKRGGNHGGQEQPRLMAQASLPSMLAPVHPGGGGPGLREAEQPEPGLGRGWAPTPGPGQGTARVEEGVGSRGGRLRGRVLCVSGTPTTGFWCSSEKRPGLPTCTPQNAQPGHRGKKPGAQPCQPGWDREPQAPQREAPGTAPRLPRCPTHRPPPGPCSSLYPESPV